MLSAYSPRRFSASSRLSFCSTLAHEDAQLLCAQCHGCGFFRRRPAKMSLLQPLEVQPEPVSIPLQLFSRSRLRLQNTNSAPSNGSRWKLPSTMAARPLILFRMSVTPHARYTCFCPKLSMTRSAPAATPPVVPADSRCQRSGGYLCAPHGAVLPGPGLPAALPTPPWQSWEPAGLLPQLPCVCRLPPEVSAASKNTYFLRAIRTNAQPRATVYTFQKTKNYIVILLYIPSFPRT